MPWAAGTIIGTIARAISTQMGFSGATVLPACATPPRRTAPVRSSKLSFTPGAAAGS